MSGGETTRGLSSDVKTQLASGSFNMSHLVKLELNTTYYYTDSRSDVVDGSDTYSANGFLHGLAAINESSAINIGSMTLRISGVNQTIISDVLTNGHLHRAVTVKRAILNDSDAVVGSFVIYKGFIEAMSITDRSESSSVNFMVANHWADFARIEGRATNNSSQQHHYAGDRGFEFSDQATKKLKWGDLDINMERQHDLDVEIDSYPGGYEGYNASDDQYSEEFLDLVWSGHWWPGAVEGVDY